MAVYDDYGYLTHAEMDADVFALCTQHVLSTEEENSIGFLVGEVDYVNKKAFIKSAIMTAKSNEKIDQLEFTPEQYNIAANHVDKLAGKLKKTWRIIGWYNSHPHERVWPVDQLFYSDLLTQAVYQMMNPCFFGLIFYVYPNDPFLYTNSVNMCCFQSMEQEFKKKCISLKITPSKLSLHNLKGFVGLPEKLYKEEVQLHAELNSYGMDDFTMLYNEAIKTMNLIDVLNRIAKPLAIDLEERLNTTRKRIGHLENIKRSLQTFKDQ